MILGLTHVGLTVREMDRSLEYYQKNLGLDMLSDAPRKGEAAEKITGVQGIHTRTVYLADTPHKHLELFQFYNPKTPPAKRELGFRVGILYVVFVRRRLETLSESRIPPTGDRWPLLFRKNEEEPFSGHRIITMQDPDGILLRIVELENGEAETTKTSWHGLLYSTLIVEKLETSLEFYQKTLGLDIAAQGMADSRPITSQAIDTSETIRWVLLRAATGVCLRLVQPLDCEILPAHRWRMEKIGFTHVAFAVKDIEGYFTYLSRRGITFISAPQGLDVGPHKEGRCVYLTSPEGIILEFLDSPLTREEFIPG